MEKATDISFYGYQISGLSVMKYVRHKRVKHLPDNTRSVFKTCREQFIKWCGQNWPWQKVAEMVSPKRLMKTKQTEYNPEAE